MGDEIEPAKTTPSLFRNYISMGAASVALACLASILLLFLVEITGRRSSPYIGILAWVILPSILVLSLIVMFAGTVRERRHRRELSRAGVTTYPTIDLNDPRRRKIFLISQQ